MNWKINLSPFSFSCPFLAFASLSLFIFVDEIWKGTHDLRVFFPNDKRKRSLLAT